MTKKKKKSSRKLMEARYRRRSSQEPFQAWLTQDGKQELVANRAGRRKIVSERRQEPTDSRDARLNARKHRLAKARLVIKKMRKELRKHLRKLGRVA